jgi:hypothetical protein
VKIVHPVRRLFVKGKARKAQPSWLLDAAGGRGVPGRQHAFRRQYVDP